MSSPSSSISSLPQSSRTPSPSGPASTAPSTPSDAPATYFLITHNASAAFLESLPARRSSKDRILHFSGTGKVKALLAEASDVLADCSVSSSDHWERAKGTDNGEPVEYWCTASAASKMATPLGSAAAEFMELETNSPVVSLLASG